MLSTALRTLLATVRKAIEDRAQDMAAAITYYTFFSIFPLLLGLVAIGGFFIDPEQIQARLSAKLAETLPGSSEFVRETLEGVVELRGTMGFVSILALLWSASAAFGAITRAVNVAWGTNPRPRPLSKLRYLLMTITATFLIVASLAAGAFLELYAQLDFTVLDGFLAPTLGIRLWGWLTSLALTFLWILLLYKVTPFEGVEVGQIWRGALFGSLLLESAKVLFLAYLDRVANFQAVYGSISSIIVLMLWLYVSAWILILGAELNGVLRQPKEVAP